MTTKCTINKINCAGFKDGECISIENCKHQDYYSKTVFSNNMCRDCIRKCDLLICCPNKICTFRETKRE